jgi:hypothetical protein
VHRDVAGDEIDSASAHHSSDQRELACTSLRQRSSLVGNPPIDPEIAGLQEHESTAAAATP